MFRFFFSLACLAGVATNCFSQSETEKTKKYDHYAGFQANELIRQLINLSSSSTAVNNPYVAIYSISSTRTRWGAHAGIGYDYSKIINNDLPGSRETKVNDLFYRVGAEKKFSLGKRFEAGAALDFTGSRKLDKTFSISVTNVGSGIDSVVSIVTQKITSLGGGPQFSLSYHITERLLLTTEATLYYNAEKEKENILIIDTFTDVFNNNEKTVTTTNQNTGTDTDRFKLTIPVAVFLVIKF